MLFRYDENMYYYNTYVVIYFDEFYNCLIDYN